MFVGLRNEIFSFEDFYKQTFRVEFLKESFSCENFFNYEEVFEETLSTLKFLKSFFSFEELLEKILTWKIFSTKF